MKLSKEQVDAEMGRIKRKQNISTSIKRSNDIFDKSARAIVEEHFPNIEYTEGVKKRLHRQLDSKCGIDAISFGHDLNIGLALRLSHTKKYDGSYWKTLTLGIDQLNNIKKAIRHGTYMMPAIIMECSLDGNHEVLAIRCVKTIDIHDAILANPNDPYDRCVSGIMKKTNLETEEEFYTVEEEWLENKNAPIRKWLPENGWDGPPLIS